MHKNKKIKIFVSILISVMFLGGFVFYYRTKQNENLPALSGLSYEYRTEAQVSVSDFMEKLKSEGKIDFKEKIYVGMGKFIDEINGQKNSGDKNWIYYVNGKKASIGISNYQINPGDVVSWKYEVGY